MRIFQGNSAPNGLLVVSNAYKYFNGSLRKKILSGSCKRSQVNFGFSPRARTSISRDWKETVVLILSSGRILSSVAKHEEVNAT